MSSSYLSAFAFIADALDVFFPQSMGVKKIKIKTIISDNLPALIIICSCLFRLSPICLICFVFLFCALLANCTASAI